jgi:hypothetical protein
MSAALAVEPEAEAERQFSLVKLARETWDELGSADYHVLAKEIARRVPAHEREAALLEALLPFCRDFNRQMRPSMSRRSVPAAQKNSGRSSKVAAIRAAWPQLRATYFTKDGQKALGECTPADLVFISEHLETKARENQRKASWVRDLCAEVRKAKVGRVRDLSDDVLAMFLSPQAAS